MDSLTKRLLRDERARRTGAALAERRSQMSTDEVAGSEPCSPGR